MRIGFLTASLSRRAGGVYDAARQLAKGLYALSDCEVGAFGLVDEETEQDIAGWAPVSAYASPVVGPGLFGYAPGLAGALDEYAPDLLHTHGLWMYPSLASRNWGGRWSKPYVISPHGMLDPWAVNNSRWKKRLAGWLYEDAHLCGATCIHALCEAEAKAIRAYGLTNPICVIPNGVELPPLEKCDGAAVWEADLPAGAKVVLYLGRIHPKKGLRELVRGWHEAMTQGGVPEEWHLVIAGWDQAGHEAELKNLVNDLHLAERVHFAGPQFGQDKQLTYKRAAAFVLPSFSEGLPMVVLEAWSYGLPVLMTPQCNLPDGFEADAAIKVLPDVKDIAERLHHFFSMPEKECMAYGTRGRLLVESKFTWPHVASQMYDVYQWVLSGGTRPQSVKNRIQ